MSLLVILLLTIGLPLVVAPGALLTAVQCPEFVTGRRSQPRPRTVVRRWQVA
jgi:hypothetical protein